MIASWNLLCSINCRQCLTWASKRSHVEPGLFHSHPARLRINSEANRKSRLKTTNKSF
ncbi:MAG: hypothetical protein RMZ95_022300 [Nostoc sp. DedQUE07]